MTKNKVAKKKLNIVIAKSSLPRKTIEDSCKKIKVA